MVIKTFLRKSFLLGARFSGLAHLLSSKLEGRGAILMLHRVSRKTSTGSINSFLSVSPKFLDEALTLLRRSGYVFCSIDEIGARLRDSIDPEQKFLAVTLDDGYRDNMTTAKPIFEAHRVPYTIYVCPGFADRYAHLWWENLATIIENQNRIAFPTGDGMGWLDCDTNARKQAAYDKLCDFVTNDLDEHEQRRFVDDLCVAYGLDPKAHVDAEMMNWDELRLINQSRLCTIGAHTLNHFHLARLDRDEAVREMEQSATAIALELGERPKHFAFPYGSSKAAGRRETDIARELGFETAVTTRHGLLHAKHANALHGLPRISMNGNYQRPVYLRTLLNGIAVPFANRGSRFVTT
ncbi:MAG: polysaccharide deacetylase family protein [Pseudomonadota bacterium]